MKIASYRHQEAEGFGVVMGDALFELVPRLGGRAASLVEALERGLMDEIRTLAERRHADLAVSEVELLAPVLRPQKIICVGINYRGRPEEYGKAEEPPFPSLFHRNTRAQVGHGGALKRPPESEQFDYEGEIALIIGKGGRRIAKAEALSHIAGYSCFNEGSVRDWMRHGQYNVTAGKNFEASGSFGPWMATPDEIADPHNLRLTTRVNGNVVQNDTTASLIFPFETLIHYISTFTTLDPGDVIVTGTPAGSGAKQVPPRWLRAGDVLEIEVEGVGTLRNTVVDEVATASTAGVRAPAPATVS